MPLSSYDVDDFSHGGVSHRVYRRGSGPGVVVMAEIPGITPQVIELEDRTVMLSGNVEDQYAQWRVLLEEIYRAEVGALELPEESAANSDTF